MKITLKNGIEIVVKNNTAGYANVTVSPAWTLDASKPFIAMTSNPTEPNLKKELTAKLRQSLHLGHYEDAREAAYVVGMYKASPLETLRKFNNHGEFTVFPSDLYEQPEGLSIDKSLIQPVTVKKRPVANLSDIPAKNNLLTYFKHSDIVQLANDIGGAEPFQQYIAGMSIQDFINDFQLDYK